MKAGPVEVGEATIDVSSVEKVFFPGEGYTKGDVVEHYLDVAQIMLPYVAGRPLTLQRFPDGIGGSGFYQKNASGHFPDWLRTVTVERRQKGGSIEHVVVENAAGLVYLANQGTVTFHIWPSRADDLDVPDVLVFDLDPPGEDTEVAVLRAGARLLRDVLEEVGLVPFVQTSGSRGFHIVAPIAPDAGFDRAGNVAHALADRAAERDPERFTTAFRKNKREGRVFIDTNRNAYAQTFVAPYSIRPRDGAPIATPIDWDELGRVEPRSYTLANIGRRLGQKADPWARMRQDARPLPDVDTEST